MNSDKEELNIDDLDFTMGGYNENKDGVEANSQHPELFRADALQSHQEFHGVTPNQQGLPNRRFTNSEPLYKPQGNRIPDYEPVEHEGRRTCK